jgi:chloramphenicol O-acetyltransferase
MLIPLSGHVHHALADGLQVEQFFTTMEELITEKNG